MSAAPATVLVVEDEAALRQVLQRALERQGYRVLAAGSAETAYELLGSERAEAVLLDVQLPVMSGLALYLALLHRAPALAGRIAIMTGDAEADSVRVWLERNPCTVLHKPFDLHQILDWVRSVVDASGERRGKG
jgi:DNA-binding NtrC family response regulator